MQFRAASGRKELRPFLTGVTVLITLITGCVGSSNETVDQVLGAYSDTTSDDTAAGEEAQADQEVIQCEPRGDGCGPSGLWAQIIPDCPADLVCFTEACSQHDLCYATCGSSQSGCDTKFYLDMVSICSAHFSEDDPRYERCAVLASVYWQAVNVFGEEAFQATQLIICTCLELRKQQLAEIEKPIASGTMISELIPSELMVASYADSDGDLIPDDWEIRVGMDPYNGLDAMEDPDADGLVNLTEFIHDTNPFHHDTDGNGTHDAQQVD